MKNTAKRYEMNWSGNTRKIPWDTLPERVDIIPTSMVATMATAESDWDTSKLARSNDNLFSMEYGRGRCNDAPGKVKGYSQLESVKESVSAYVISLNTHPAYSSLRKLHTQLREADQEVTATTMIHRLKGYSTKGQNYSNYLLAMYQDNQRLIAAYMQFCVPDSGFVAPGNNPHSDTSLLTSRYSFGVVSYSFLKTE